MTAARWVAVRERRLVMSRVTTGSNPPGPQARSQLWSVPLRARAPLQDDQILTVGCFRVQSRPIAVVHRLRQLQTTCIEHSMHGREIEGDRTGRNLLIVDVAPVCVVDRESEADTSELDLVVANMVQDRPINKEERNDCQPVRLEYPMNSRR